LYFVLIQVALYAITAAYFAGVMVRLMLTLTPVVCVLSAIAFSECFSYCLQDEKEKPTSQRPRVNSADGSVDSSTDSEENSQNGPEKNNHKNLYDKVIN